MKPVAGKKDPIRPWYEAMGSLGDYVMIRFGHIRPGSNEVRWISVPHSEFDGIGGFAHLMRSKGLVVDQLPENPHPSPPSWRPFVRALPKFFGPRRRLKWKPLPQGPPVTSEVLPDPALAWHLFSEEETLAIRVAARSRSVTVNTFLMKFLDTVLRGDLHDGSAEIPWMIPVNLRGKVTRESDTQNHSSYVSVAVGPEQCFKSLHDAIYEKLERGEHWGNWMGYSATAFLPQSAKRALIKADRAMAEWNLGLFTNLGVWDPGKEITHEDFAGSWIVAATVLRCQMVGAGVMTFQGKLSLTLQVHPDLTTAQKVPEDWLRAWLAAIRVGLAAESPPTGGGF